MLKQKCENLKKKRKENERKLFPLLKKNVIWF